MTVYRIKDWDDIFVRRDAARGRKLPWISVPTRHDGLGFRRLSRRPRGIEIYGAFVLMATVASKCPTQGILADEKGNPITATDLADRTGFSEEGFIHAIEVLSDLSIGWLVALPENADAGNFDDSAGKNGKPAGKIPDSAGRKQDSAVLRNDTRRNDTRRPPPNPDGEDIFSGEDHSETDETLLHLVRSRIRWQVKDPHVQAQHEASILAWLRSPDRAILLEIAEQEHRKRRKAAPWWELEEILTERKKTSASVPRKDPRVAHAEQLVAKHGVARIRELTKVPSLTTEQVAVEALTENPELADMVERGAA